MIVVTGGSGFIGSVLIEQLNELGREDIILVDHVKNNNLKKIKYSKYIDANEFINNESQENIEVIFHMGACSSTTEKDLNYLNENNVEYSKKMFDLSVKNNATFIYASSAATYGDGENGYSDEHIIIPKLKPLNPYGDSKQSFDLWMLEQKKIPKAWYGLKFFNVFGPNEYHKKDMRSLVHKAFYQIQENGKVKLFKSYKKDFEDGKQLRDFVYVKDVCRGMIHLMNERENCGIYNMGTGSAKSFYDLVQFVFEAIDKKTNIEFIEMPSSIKNQYQYYTQADMKKFFNLIPEFQFMSLRDSVFDYVKNYLLKEKYV